MMFTRYMTTTQTPEITTHIVPSGGEFEVAATVNGVRVHIAWTMDRARAEQIAAGIYAK